MRTFIELISLAAFMIVGALAFDCANYDSNQGATFDLTELSRYVVVHLINLLI